MTDGEKTFPINSNKKKQRISGSMSFSRLYEYVYILLDFFKLLLKVEKPVLYITTSQSLPGFFRDFIFIHYSIIIK
jgi:hypothetical protein